MNPAIRAMWKAALTSGEYEQGEGWLRNSKNRYCCLGVLCDIYQKETGEGKWTDGHTDSAYRFDTGGFDSSACFLPQKVARWAGLEDTAPLVEGKRITWLNDHGTTFPQIAELLDQL